MNNVSFSYNPGIALEVLSDINITFPKGKITAIIGSSGSGKTTLIKMLLGFYQPNSGKISIGDKLLNSFNLNIWRSYCGTVLQDGYIFSDTITFNVTLENTITNIERLELALYIANISDFIKELPLGLNTQIGVEGIGLSQGQKQRILIARSIYKNPLFLFFDEATNSLDANNEKIINTRLQEFYKKGQCTWENKSFVHDRTVIIVAHRLSTVRNADQIVVIEKGKIVEIGTHQELIKNNGRYLELVGDQLDLDA